MAVLGGVSGDQPLLHGLGQRRADAEVTALHQPVRHAGAVEVAAEEASVLLELCVELLQVLGGPAVYVAGDMGAGVQRERRVGVAQDAGQRLGVHAPGDGMGGKSMEEELVFACFETQNTALTSCIRAVQPCRAHNMGPVLVSCTVRTSIVL